MDGTERWRVLRLHVEDQVPLTALARDTGISARTLQRWHHLYRTQGISALDPHPRADSGTRRTAAETVAFIEHLALTRPRPSIAMLHRLARADATQRNAPEPSYAAVYEIVKALDPALVTLALEGPAAYRDRHELVFRRRADRPNQTWQSDHTELDILIIGADGKPDRPWLTTVMDDHSRAICGYIVFSGAPSAINTALALRQAIWRKTDPAWAMCGIPDILHVDHGSDFTSHHLERTAVALHIRIIHSTIARPQGRGKIERFFGTVNTELLAALPGHLGPGSRKPTPTLDLPALDRALGEFITTYNDRPHSELGISPRDAWVADGWLPRMPDSLEELDGLLLTVPKNRVVQRDGIHFQGQRYLAPTLAPFVGHIVTIRYDPRDISEIRVYDRDTFVCVAVDEAHPNIRLSLRDIETARRARKRELRHSINERIPAVAAREEPRSSEPKPPRRQLRTYEED
ncbi:transposase [Cryobacterium roopkundense]|uniref:Transposase n=1 Tax=Cryobacterium roopkundense TaxID=1001240 RepID=A0A099J2J0_9MICO|nr:Mu transposase C-terminal domain-containing protein [Cryobacterium roopkundense]KGJ71767.1 transposase [Cryobacterium roopkundense]MBB5643512.1 putative transposase [Cryobacterium roopkundense]